MMDYPASRHLFMLLTRNENKEINIRFLSRTSRPTTIFFVVVIYFREMTVPCHSGGFSKREDRTERAYFYNPKDNLCVSKNKTL